MLKSLENYKADSRCVPCGVFGDGMVCYHHLKTRGSGGLDSEQNLIPVCLKCHNEFHAKGTVFMAEKYHTVSTWLINNGWEFCEFKKAWIFDKSKIV